jgi:RNA polymerase sigma-70 factor (ECF subfamily)
MHRGHTSEDLLNVDSAELCFDLPVSRATEGASLADEVEAFYLSHHASLYRFLIASRCPAELAPDLLQEAFLRLYQNLRAGKSIERPRSWLVSVVQNLLFNHFRKYNREVAIDEVFGEAETRTGDDDLSNPELRYARRQRIRQLADAMRQLTSTQSRYLLLRAEGLKFREIAALHGVSTGTVADACSRALEKLRNLTHE